MPIGAACGNITPHVPRPPTRMPTDQPPSRQCANGPHDLRDSDVYQWLAGQVRQHDVLERRLRKVLPEPLRQQVRLAGVKDGCLVFLVPSPAWATRLRTLQVPILAAARRLGIRAHAVAARVAPTETMPEPERPRGKPLSPATAEHLRRTARTLSDPGLRDAFLGLAATAETPDPQQRDA